MLSKRIACWMSDKKSQKINWVDFEKTCKRHGFDLFKLDLNRSLESQEPFCVLLHKLTDIIASANQDDIKSAKLIKKVENYIACNPSITIVDPIPNVRQLLNRYKAYSIINSTSLHNCGVFTPSFGELNSMEPQDLVNQLRNAGVAFPFICKPPLGHGSRQAHEMSIIFNEKGLSDCRPPCVAQNFINHNAVLYKIFIVGPKCHFVERPSLKNFYAGDEATTIHFDSGNVSKAGSQSSLSVLDPNEKGSKIRGPDPKTLEMIAYTLRRAFGMDLLGVDVVIENFTGKYAIIDVNAYPGYDGFPNFFDALLECIDMNVSSRLNATEERSC